MEQKKRILLLMMAICCMNLNVLAVEPFSDEEEAPLGIEATSSADYAGVSDLVPVAESPGIVEQASVPDAVPNSAANSTEEGVATTEMTQPVFNLRDEGAVKEAPLAQAGQEGLQEHRKGEQEKQLEAMMTHLVASAHQAEKDAQATYTANPALYSGIVKALLATESIAYKRLYDLLYDVTRAFRSALTPEQAKEVLELVELFEAAFSATASPQGASAQSVAQSVEAMNKLRIKLLPYTFVEKDASIPWPSREKMGVEFKALMHMMLDTLKAGSEMIPSQSAQGPSMNVPSLPAVVPAAPKEKKSMLQQPKKMVPETQEAAFPAESAEQANIDAELAIPAEEQQPEAGVAGESFVRAKQIEIPSSAEPQVVCRQCQVQE